MVRDRANINELKNLIILTIEVLNMAKFLSYIKEKYV